jgi:hypothetical protein
MNFYGYSEDVHIAHNVAVRPTGAPQNTCFTIASQANLNKLVSGVTFVNNTAIQYTDYGCVVFEDGNDIKANDNRIYYYGGGAATVSGMSIRAATLSRKNWEASGNHVLARSGTLDRGINFSITGALTQDGITANRNQFEGCNNGVGFTKTTGTFNTNPVCIGNQGATTPFANLANVTAVVVGGNHGTNSPADYIYNTNGAPTHSAANGSTARRINGGPPNLYVRESAAWVGK